MIRIIWRFFSNKTAKNSITYPRKNRNFLIFNKEMKLLKSTLISFFGNFMNMKTYLHFSEYLVPTSYFNYCLV
jgi:hypothetical protein